MNTFKTFLAEMVATEASRIILNALKAVDRHTNTDAYKPYHKKVRINTVDGQSNLVNITFPVEGMPAGRITKDGPFERDHKASIIVATNVAKELLEELKGTINIEDSNIEEKPRGVTLFVVSDDLA